MESKKENVQVDIERLAGDEDASSTSSGNGLTTKFKDFNDKFDVDKYGETQRKLSSRHVGLMIIGQAIGSGLFIGLSTPMVTSGSLSLFIGFVFYAVFVIWPLMQAVAEMCSFLPIKGSFLHYSARWVDPALGFTCTMLYLYTSLMYIALEATGFAGVVGFWTDINPGVFITVALVSTFCFNVFGVNWYGEIEFVTSITKVLLVVGLMMFSLISMCGGNPKGDAYGFENWSKGGLVKEYLVPGTTGRFLGFWKVLIYAALSCGGPDLLGMIAGEVSRPRTVIPMAGRRAYIRIYIFYLGGLFFMNSICASNDPKLTAANTNGAVGAAASPWVIGMSNVGVHGLDSLVNVVVALSAWSCGNAFMYGATRTAYAASLAGYLPRFFSKCLSNGCPIYTVIFSILIACISYLGVSNSTGLVFNWLVNLSTTGILLTYTCIWWCYFKYKKAFKAQGFDYETDSYYKPSFFVHPYMTYLSFFLIIIILIFNGFWVFFPGNFTVADLFTSYFAPIFAVCLFTFWKFFKKTKFRTDLEADLLTGKQHIDDEEAIANAEYAARPRKSGIFWKAYYKTYDVCFG
ncbi:probable lysine/arginine permease Can2p [[Candida] jaroonii]|uniref:Probable lysine/arginine permease Can2p n=1 Tax=[Candida] jaroonii TaxID=467808 RepID=A0ACA9Y4G9_9ASCO|nr:probable lysine/arginine permease Can2p [[Candida] jaroonii]